MALEDAKIVQPIYDFCEPTEILSATDMSHIVQGYDPSRLDYIKYRRRFPCELRRPIIVDGLDVSASFLTARDSVTTNSLVSIQPLVKTISFFISHGHRVIIILPAELDNPNYYSRSRMINILIKMGMVAFVSCGDEPDKMNVTFNNHLVAFATIVDGCIVTSQKMTEMSDRLWFGRRLLPPMWKKAKGSEELELCFDMTALFALNGGNLEQTLMATGDASTEPCAFYQLRGCQQLRTLLALSHIELNGHFDCDFANRLYGKLNFAMPVEEKGRANRPNDYREGGAAVLIDFCKARSFNQEEPIRLEKELAEPTHQETDASVIPMGLSSPLSEKYEKVEPTTETWPKEQTTLGPLIDSNLGITPAKEDNVPTADEGLPPNKCFLCRHVFGASPAICPFPPLPPKIVSLPASSGEKEEKGKKVEENAGEDEEAKKVEKEKVEEVAAANDEGSTLFMLLAARIGVDHATRTMRMCPTLATKSDLSSLLKKAVEFFGPRLIIPPMKAIKKSCKRYGKKKAIHTVRKLSNCQQRDTRVKMKIHMPMDVSLSLKHRLPSSLICNDDYRSSAYF
uniref:RNase NYN domain-containing protein n=1 Tax=Plectus sambesii TaxID=2011161 RepID=A0A914VKK5_9BILA